MAGGVAVNSEILVLRGPEVANSVDTDVAVGNGSAGVMLATGCGLKATVADDRILEVGVVVGVTASRTLAHAKSPVSKTRMLAR